MSDDVLGAMLDAARLPVRGGLRERRRDRRVQEGVGHPGRALGEGPRAPAGLSRPRHRRRGGPRRRRPRLRRRDDRPLRRPPVRGPVHPDALGGVPHVLTREGRHPCTRHLCTRGTMCTRAPRRSRMLYLGVRVSGSFVTERALPATQLDLRRITVARGVARSPVQAGRDVGRTPRTCGRSATSRCPGRASRSGEPAIGWRDGCGRRSSSSAAAASSRSAAAGRRGRPHLHPAARPRRRSAAAAATRSSSTDEDLTTAFYRDDVLDLADMVREQFYLAMPMRPLCREALPRAVPAVRHEPQRRDLPVPGRVAGSAARRCDLIEKQDR